MIYRIPLFQRDVGRTNRITNRLYGLAAYGEEKFVSFEDELNQLVFFKARSRNYRKIRELSAPAKEKRKETGEKYKGMSSIIRSVAVDNFGPEHEPKRIALCDWGELFFY
jgi:hypothetical protein